MELNNLGIKRLQFNQTHVVTCSNHNCCEICCFHILVSLFLVPQYLPIHFVMYLYMKKCHKYIFSFWTSRCRCLLEYPATQIWTCYLIWKLWRWFTSSKIYFLQLQVARVLLNNLAHCSVFLHLHMDLITPWNFSKIARLVCHTHIHTMYVWQGVKSINILKTAQNFLKIKFLSRQQNFYQK